MDAEKPIEMASSQPLGYSGIQGFSGAMQPFVIPIATSTSPEDQCNRGGDYFTTEEIARTKPTKLNPKDLKKLRKLIDEEKAAQEALRQASRRRDLFCVDLEKEYGLNGWAWTVDLDKAIIQITGPRKKPGE